MSLFVQNQLLATKFYVPVAPGTLISRPRLTTLLNKSLWYPFTLVSAPAGFGKTTLLASWSQSLLANHRQVAWISLDEEDNDPRLFWTYVLTALKMQQPERFTALLMLLQAPEAQPLKSVLAALINLLLEETDEFLLILDDYQVITEPEVHTTLVYLIEHLPAQLRIIMATRADPPLPLPLLRARELALEVRTDQLRCTVEETGAYFHKVMGLHLPDETIQQVTSRTEGWLVGLQLLGLSLPEQTDPLSLLQEIRGDQCYILDYLTEVVLKRQPQKVQTFLLCTSILDQFCASLCDTVLEQTRSQQMLQWLEQANLFMVSLDSKRQWYRYHALFAEALRGQLEQTCGDLVLTLHHRASLWYAKHDQTTQAILHAFRAKEWPWAADLIEQKSRQLIAFTWGTGEHEIVLLRQWLELLPADLISSRPRLSLACAQLLWATALPTKLYSWLDMAETSITASLAPHSCEVIPQPILASQARLEQQNLLGWMIAFRAFLQSFDEHGEVALPLCQKALSLLLTDNYAPHTFIAWARLYAYYCSVNNTEAALECGQQAVSLAQISRKSEIIIIAICLLARLKKDVGQLHEVYLLTRQAIQLGTQLGGSMLPEAGHPAVLQAEILREWNQLDAASTLIEEAMLLSKQSKMLSSHIYLLLGYSVQLRVSLSCGDLEMACSALQHFEYFERSVNQPFYLHMRSYYTTVDQVRLWLACGELERAMRWGEELDMRERHGNLLAREREEVAQARILLAMDQPIQALQRLQPVLRRATAGQRWGHVIEIQLLQALAYQMCQQEIQALDTLSEAVRLAEPEGYIRSFVDEGAPMEILLYRLWKRDHKQRPNPYLDTLLAAFQQESKAHVPTRQPAKVQPLLEPLSERELDVLQLLVQGASNQEIAQQLVIAYNTVKRHVSHIFSKLGVQNRVQAVKQARALGLLDEAL